MQIVDICCCWYFYTCAGPSVLCPHASLYVFLCASNSVSCHAPLTPHAKSHAHDLSIIGNTATDKDNGKFISLIEFLRRKFYVYVMISSSSFARPGLCVPCCCCRWLRWFMHIVVPLHTLATHHCASVCAAAILVWGFVCLDNLLMNAFAYYLPWLRLLLTLPRSGLFRWRLSPNSRPPIPQFVTVLST